MLQADPPPAAYSVETLALAVAAGALAALGAGFAAGYICGRRCKKDDDDNMPYPDTEYEYFEQRQNINRYKFYLHTLSLSYLSIYCIYLHSFTLCLCTKR